tara:strand:+ start:791 stop:1021 length:231 start_codon:yes stop_codon:yes gene_type:complete
MLAEKKNALKTLKSAILKSYSENKNLDFTNLEDLAFDLQVDIETEEDEIETELNRFYSEVRETVESDYYAFRQSQM